MPDTFLVAQDISVNKAPKTLPPPNYILVDGDREFKHKSEKCRVCHLVRSGEKLRKEVGWGVTSSLGFKKDGHTCITEKRTFEQRREGGEGVGQAPIWGKTREDEMKGVRRRVEGEGLR